MSISPRTRDSIQQGGGRHYKGGGLGQLKGWKCVACNAENAGPLTAGCTSCGAGAPGTQVRKHGEGEAPAPASIAVAGTTASQPTSAMPAKRPVPERSGRTLGSGTALAQQLRRQMAAAAVDYDEIERRVTRVLEARLGGGFSEAERATIYLALTAYISLWEDGLIAPEQGLPLEKTRELAARIGPEDLPDLVPAESVEAETYGTTETPSATAEGQGANSVGSSAAGRSGDDDGTSVGDPSSDEYPEFDDGEGGTVDPSQ